MSIKIIICSILAGMFVSSLVFGTIIHNLEMGHRNFEYVQCEQFWELAINTNKTDNPLFDCNLILEEGVLKFDLTNNDPIINNNNSKIEYAYQDYVDDLREGDKR